MALPLVSVIVPGHDASATVEACLPAFASQTWPRDRCEILYVDDASTDGSAELAMRWADRVIRLTGSRAGPAAARNVGVGASSGEFLVFIDADVVVRPDTLSAVVQHLVDEPGLDAIFGSYDQEPAHPGWVSQYRNLLHHYVHQTSRGDAQTFWTGCGAVRRSSFERIGGFDSRWRYMHDVELGYRMRGAGMRIRLAHSIQVKHLKRWTFLGMLRTDIFGRGIPWTRLLLGQGLRAPGMGDLNLTWVSQASIPLAWGAASMLPAAYWQPWLLPWALGAAGLVMLMNLPTYAFFSRIRGVGFALRAVPLHFLYHLCNGVSVLGGILWWGVVDRALPRLRPIGAARGPRLGGGTSATP